MSQRCKRKAACMDQCNVRGKTWLCAKEKKLPKLV